MRPWWHATGLIRGLSAERVRVESVALQLRRVCHTPRRSLTLTPSLQMSGLSSAAAAASSKAKSPGSKKSKGSKGSAGPKDSKSSASAVTKTGSSKGNKRKGKEAGLAEKPRWDTSYKIPKRSAPDTSVSSGGPTPPQSWQIQVSYKEGR